MTCNDLPVELALFGKLRVLHGLLARFGVGARMARVRVVRPGVGHKCTLAVRSTLVGLNHGKASHRRAVARFPNHALWTN